MINTHKLLEGEERTFELLYQLHTLVDASLEIALEEHQH